MISFFVCLAILILGYYLYSKLVEKSFGQELVGITPSLLYSYYVHLYRPLKQKVKKHNLTSQKNKGIAKKAIPS